MIPLMTVIATISSAEYPSAIFHLSDIAQLGLPPAADMGHEKPLVARRPGSLLLHHFFGSASFETAVLGWPEKVGAFSWPTSAPEVNIASLILYRVADSAYRCDQFVVEAVVDFSAQVA